MTAHGKEEQNNPLTRSVSATLNSESSSKKYSLPSHPQLYRFSTYPPGKSEKISYFLPALLQAL